MTFDEMYSAVRQAEHTLSLTDTMADKLASLLIPRINQVSPWKRAALKKALRRYYGRNGQEL